MVKAFSVLLLLALAGCSGVPSSQYASSACAGAEASQACQVERYQNAP